MRVQFLVAVLSVFIMSIFAQAFIASATMLETPVDNSYSSTTPLTPTFVVQTIKYDPYPVNPGQWFDLWVKVQNVGQDSAPDARFILIPEYPFTSNDTLVRDYGNLPGTSEAYKVDKTNDATTVILKYRIRVADNAPEGSNSTLKFATMTDKTQGSQVVQKLPVTVGKTKTDFDVVMQDSTAQGTSFAIANTGQNPATAVTFSVDAQTGVTVTGARSSILGNLATGDFTTVTFQIGSNPSLQEIKIRVDYTDIVGVRNSIVKVVPVSIASSASTIKTATKSTTSAYTAYLPYLIGLILGIILMVIYGKFRKKKN